MLVKNWLRPPLLSTILNQFNFVSPQKIDVKWISSNLNEYKEIISGMLAVPAGW